ncbi:DNA cytosine methyltransferase [Qipengyuania sp. R86523]|uniref:DNA cytosine methyltransferase n=1 Tax=Qipengyuania sp. R86523 TaxID=3093862 RepID=UPI0037C84B2E
MTTSMPSWTVADLFSCGGGTSAGFGRKEKFQLVAALDSEIAKPSGGPGTSDCNATYEANHGIRPLAEDIATFSPASFKDAFGIQDLSVLISCAPCTDFSRAKPENHIRDSKKNDLVGRGVDYVEALRPEIFFLENARELISGNLKHHHTRLCERLKQLGYEVRSEVLRLDRYGLPQIRERAVVIASRIGQPRTLSDLWGDWEVDRNAITVRSALERLEEAKEASETHPSGDFHPRTGHEVSLRIAATPKDGGSWIDLARHPHTRELLPPVCLRRWESGKIGSHPDVYGRMAWDRPSPTIKRECGHVGNGRYTHPEKNRLLTVREMATLQGFPFDYVFAARSIANRYRHIGDAVPPLIAWQFACLAEWMKIGRRPEPEQWVMPKTSLCSADLRRQR